MGLILDCGLQNSMDTLERRTAHFKTWLKLKNTKTMLTTTSRLLKALKSRITDDPYGEEN